MFRLEEFAEVLFRGRESVPEEVDVLRDLIPVAKNLYRNPGGGAFLRRGGDALTADTPVPYRMADLIKQIDERMGLLESKNDRPILKSLRTRIESAISDPRYRFMFNSRLIEDTIHETIGNIFRVPHDGRPVTCFEMAGMPSEVVNSVCSVLARLAFDLALWSEGKLAPAGALRGSAPLHAGRSAARLRADPARAVAHRQGRPQIRLLSRRRHPAAGRARSDHPVAMLDRLRHAARQRAGPGDHPLGDRQFLGVDAVLPVLDGPARGDRLRRGRRHHHAAEIRAAGRQAHPRRRQEATTAEAAAGDGDDVDLVAIVERLQQRAEGGSRTSPSPNRSAPQRQPGDPGYRKPEPRPSSRCRTRTTSTSAMG